MWFYSDLTEAYPPSDIQERIINVTIIERENHSILYDHPLDKDNYVLFKKIMRYDKYALQFIYHDILRDAAVIKIRQSPHKPILNSLDPKVWREECEYYIGD